MYLLYFGDIPNLVSCAFSTIPIFPPFNSQNFLFTCNYRVEDFKHPVPQRLISVTEQLFREEPIIVDPHFRLTSDAILNALGKSAPTNFLEALEAYYILVIALQ